MPSLNKLVLPAVTLLLIAPFVGASAAHPHTHIYAGTSAGSVVLNVENDNGKISFDFQSAVVGLCADGSPFLASLVPPTPIRDGDEDIGVGGGCFAFETVYGDDTGATLTSFVQEQVRTSLRPVWIACVDSSGDGICSGNNEPYNVCTVGLTGGYSLINGGPCTTYADPAATINPALFVLIIGGLNSDGATIEPSAASAGTIFVA